jgi:N-acetylglucosaminyldiphosphoundecaprenol N-acetyl-beta-D-mannosaminyltransferase
MAKINMLGVQIDALLLDEFLDEICALAQSGQRALIAHVNIMALNLAYEQTWYRDFLNSCERVYCDGMGVKLGAYILGARIPQRFTLADWIWPLARLGAERGLAFFFLGNPPGVARRAALLLQQSYPSMVVEAQHGYFNRAAGGPENQAMLARINASGAQILMVGLGMPAQERWLQENWPHLDVPVAITCGALFEYVSGELRRGPRWMTQNYLEWLARSAISPRRYARRYLRDIPLFAYRLLHQRLAGVL